MKRILGYTEDRTVCECCGRQDLRGTYALQLEEGGETYYYGSTCAAKAHGFRSEEFKGADKAYSRAKYAMESWGGSTLGEAEANRASAMEATRRAFSALREKNS